MTSKSCATSFCHLLFESINQSATFSDVQQQKQASSACSVLKQFLKTIELLHFCLY